MCLFSDFHPLEKTSANGSLLFLAYLFVNTIELHSRLFHHQLDSSCTKDYEENSFACQKPEFWGVYRLFEQHQNSEMKFDQKIYTFHIGQKDRNIVFELKEKRQG